jgi:hypothetical protein
METLIATESHVNRRDEKSLHRVAFLADLYLDRKEISKSLH